MIQRAKYAQSPEQKKQQEEEKALQSGSEEGEIEEV